jgi:seryl-tRNA synthetase
MFDIRLIRENPTAFDAGLARRGIVPVSALILSLDEQWRALTVKVQELQARRNEASKAIGTAKSKGDDLTAASLMAEVAGLKSSLLQIEAEESTHAAQIQGMLQAIPNLPQEGVPTGADENDNHLVHENGEVPKFAFDPKEHDVLGPPLGLDFETAQKVSGARFVYLRGQVARLSRALGQFMLDLHTSEFGYQEVVPPLLVRDEAVYGVGQLPKFAEDLFRTTDNRWLTSTAEVSLTNIVQGDILAETALPLRFTALTSCFRSEAGAAGRDTRGMIRQHQFDKVELVSIVRPEEADAEHERMTRAAETVLERLGLAYRRMLLCTGDMGFATQRTYDLEVWLPGQNRYREISSCSNCGDFQARRMNTRYRPGNEKSTRFVNTLNGSGLAVGRTLVAILENYQNADGSVTVPAVLLPYMGGIERLIPA